MLALKVELVPVPEVRAVAPQIDDGLRVGLQGLLIHLGQLRDQKTEQLVVRLVQVDARDVLEHHAGTRVVLQSHEWVHVDQTALVQPQEPRILIF